MTDPTYNNYPATDDNFNFPPEIRGAIASAPEVVTNIRQISASIVHDEVVEIIAEDPTVTAAAAAKALASSGFLTSSVKAGDGVRFIDSEKETIVTILDPAGSPHFLGTNPLNAARTEGGSGIRFFDIEGIQIDTGFSAAAAGFTETHIIPVFGQSNSLGWRAAPIPEGTNDPVSNLFMIPGSGAQAGQVVPGIDPLLAQPNAGTDSTTQANARGFGIGFARWYALQHPDVMVVVVTCGFGGTGFRYSNGSATVGQFWAIDRQSESGITWLPGVLQSVVNGAVSRFSGTVKIPAMLWHQGEADAVGNVTQAQYTADVTALIAWCRANLTGASSTTPFVTGQTVWEFRNVRMPGTYDQINASQLALPATVKRTAIAMAPASAGYANTGDNTHFTSLGQWLMTQSYIDAFKLALYNI